MGHFMAEREACVLVAATNMTNHGFFEKNTTCLRGAATH
jgi:hypothetical protein